MDRYGAGHLLTVGPDGRIKAVTVDPRCEGGDVVIPSPGRGSCANAAERDQVTVLFPPLEHHGFTLLVDGAATVEGADLRVVVTSAVLHRPPSHGDGPPAPR
jgi:hypothetical protein